ncbi:MAG: RpoL/Rpb11 RNA polymerase subunit family protein [Candidatus Thermoplasmatota archaeon]|nr:RpoL/Rpb11 RNA polymerase subunit family protein [Candidatus Thermoplasmatota archaeon]
MQFDVRTHSKDTLDIGFVGERKTVLYMLKERLLMDDKVETANVLSDHPVLGDPRLVVQTSSGKPETAVKRAVKAARKELDELEDAFLADL